MLAAAALVVRARSGAIAELGGHDEAIALSL
jgi:hypothetical protein